MMTPGYQLPAEWAPQSAVLLTWPHDLGDWNDNLPAVEKNFIDIASCISRYESVIISFRTEALRDKTRSALEQAGAVMERFHFAVLPSNDVWARDHGPITVIANHRPLMLDFTFNGWGGKYAADQDNEITRTLQAMGMFGNAELESINFILEGGAIETDGQGVMLTTTGCLPLATRNPGVSIRDIENLFERHLGIHTVHWLNHGHLAGDDTDGHIDTIARFVSPEAIIYQSCDNQDDEHYEELQAMQGELLQLKQADGKPYILHALPLPQAIYDETGQRLPASYANFLIINNAVLLPTYDDPADQIAEKLLANCFPGRTIHPIDCRALIHQYGSLHCVTMQIPAQVKLTQA